MYLIEVMSAIRRKCCSTQWNPSVGSLALWRFVSDQDGFHAPVSTTIEVRGTLTVALIY